MRVPIAGWRVSLEAAIRATGAAYDTARYDNRETYTQSAPASGWFPLDDFVVSVNCGRGASRGQAPSVVASAGRLSADLYDPGRLLDPVLTDYPDLLEPGAPIRLIARKDTLERLIWTGTTRVWQHDTLTGEGRVEAVDVIGDVAPVPLTDLVRPTEPIAARIAAMLAVMPDPPPFTPQGTSRTLCAATISGDLWQALAAVVDSDQSWLWVDGAGTVRWQGRGISSATAAQFVDLPDPSDQAAAVYVGLPTASDDASIVNIVTAARILPKGATPPPPRVTSQPGSVDRHQSHSYANTALQLTTDAEVDQWAHQLLGMHAWPVEGPTGLVSTVRDGLDGATATMDAITGLDLADVVRVRLSSRGPTQEWVAVIGSIDVSCTMDTYTATFRLALPEEAGVGGYDAPSTRYDSTSAYDQTRPARRARRNTRSVFA